eukprot:5492515-Pyramimonas_sp.AAC.1
MRAEFYSDDCPDGCSPGAYACLRPLIIGEDEDENPAALGNSDTWSSMGFRADDLARIISQCAVYIARHCSDYARSSGGW